MSRKTKIVQVLWTGEIGGIEEYITSLIQYFDIDKYEMHLCFLSKRGRIYEEISVKYKHVCFIGIRNGYDFLGSFRFLQYLKLQDFDIIHMHSANLLANLVILLMRRARKVFTEHIGLAIKTRVKKRKIFYYLFASSYDAIISISGYIKEVMAKNFKVDVSKIFVIHNAIDLHKFNCNIYASEEIKNFGSNGKKLVGFVGRMVNHKRPELFIDVAREIIKSDKSFVFIIIGEGPKLAECKDKVSSWQYEDYIRFLGYRRDIPQILKALDALIFTSEIEAFGIVIIEAMAMSIPVFAINEGAIPEIITDKSDGFLLSAIAPQKIAEQFVTNMRNKTMLQKVKTKAPQTVERNFSFNVCAKKTAEIYTRIST